MKLPLKVKYLEGENGWTIISVSEPTKKMKMLLKYKNGVCHVVKEKNTEGFNKTAIENHFIDLLSAPRC